MIILLVFSFLAGIVTILAPCIWPVLPIVLSSSIAGKGHRRPLGIALGVVLSFTFFTLCASFLVKTFHVDPNVLRIVAVVVLILFGITMIIPSLAAWFEASVSRLVSLFRPGRLDTQQGFLPGFITGLSLGVVWSPCAGPILATIATLAATGKVNFSVILVTLSYVSGVGVMLFAFAFAGQQFVLRAKGLNKFTGKIQQVFGVVMILAAFAIYTNLDQTLQLQLLNAFPKLGSVVNGFENSSFVQHQLRDLKSTSQNTIQSSAADGLFNTNTPAPDFVGITKWLNTDKPQSIQSLHGKVVLVDFWTYTCINCIRTLPHVTSWYDKYKDKGFVVIGVHTPEFQFEHDSANVLHAIQMFGIHYPVAQDNDYATWQNFNNEYWPAEYLIDAEGNIRRTHFGEGEYDTMEMAIQSLLKDAGKKVTEKLDSMPDQTPTTRLSPETYVGAGRMQYYYPTGNTGVGKQTFNLAKDISENSFSLGGEWNITAENAITGKNAVLSYNFYANKVFLVLRPGKTTHATVKVFLDDKLIDSASSGADVINGEVTVDSDRLYNLVDLHGNIGNHMLRLEFETPETEVFAFTFG